MSLDIPHSFEGEGHHRLGAWGGHAFANLAGGDTRYTNKEFQVSLEIYYTKLVVITLGDD
jgi:hypothetical protein